MGSADCESMSAAEKAVSKCSPDERLLEGAHGDRRAGPPGRARRPAACGRSGRQDQGGLRRLHDLLDARSRAGDVDRDVRAVRLQHAEHRRRSPPGIFGTKRQTRSPRTQPASRSRRASRFACLLELPVRQPLLAHDDSHSVGPRLRLTRHIVLEQRHCNASSLPRSKTTAVCWSSSSDRGMSRMNVLKPRPM